MDDFAAKPGEPNVFGLVQGEANAIQPRKRPLSSMTPTIVTRDGKLHLVVGTPGGPTIINSVLEVMLNVIDFGMNVQDAVDSPRIHHQWMPDQLVMERGFSPDTIALLKARGHQVEDGRTAWAKWPPFRRATGGWKARPIRAPKARPKDTDACTTFFRRTCSSIIG